YSSFFVHTPSSTLFPYTTLFRSRLPARQLAQVHELTAARLRQPSQVGRGARFEGEFHHEIGARRLSVDHIKVVLVDGRLNRLLADRKSTRLNSSHVSISYAVFCL